MIQFMILIIIRVCEEIAINFIILGHAKFMTDDFLACCNDIFNLYK